MALWRLFPETFEAPHGAPPDIRAFPDYGEIAAWVAETIRHLSAEEGYPLSDIAVIYAMKTPKNDPGMNFPLLIGKALDKRGLLHNWISEDYRAKRSYDVTTENVTISTIHSVKGFDYACVFLLGLDWLAPGRWTEEQIRWLAYVAITRARERLFLFEAIRSGKKYLILEKYKSKLGTENRGCPQGLRRDPLNLIWVMPA